jgi:hypothetical protein
MLDATAEPTQREHKVTGTDGKTYPAQPARRTPKRAALPPQVQRAVFGLSKITRRLEKLAADERYRANRKTIDDQCTPELRVRAVAATASRPTHGYRVMTYRSAATYPAGRTATQSRPPCSARLRW